MTITVKHTMMKLYTYTNGNLFSVTLEIDGWNVKDGDLYITATDETGRKVDRILAAGHWGEVDVWTEER